jgi:hypothetical protein
VAAGGAARQGQTNRMSLRQQGMQKEAIMERQRLTSCKRNEPVDQNDQENHKKCILFKGVWHNTVPVEISQLPSTLPTWIQGRTITKKVRRAYLKMTHSMGMGLFADEKMDTGDIACVYNGKFIDLKFGETRANTAADFGAHVQSVTLDGGVQGGGTQAVDGAINGDCDLEFFVHEGAMSMMNSAPSRMEHNVDLLIWPKLYKVSGGAVQSLHACEWHSNYTAVSPT